MYVRMIHVSIDPGKRAQARDIYNNQLIFNFPGKLFHYMLESLALPDEVICMTGWTNHADALRYYHGEGYQRNLARFVPLLKGSPLVREFEVVEAGTPLPRAVEPTPDKEPLTAIGRILHQIELARTPTRSLFFRFVSLKLKPALITDARALYNTRLAAGYAMPGYHFAYFCESLAQPDEVVSLSCWDSKVQADDYAQGAGYQKDLAQFADYLVAPPKLAEYIVIVPVPAPQPA